MLKTKILIAGGVLLLAAVVVAVWLGTTGRSADEAEMRELASNYLSALYAQDYGRAYGYISARDQQTKSKTVYMRENPSFPEAARDLAAELAAFIEIGEVAATVAGDRATIQFPIRLPDANSAAIQDLFKGFDADRLAELTPEERETIVETARRMEQDGRLPMLSGTESLDLVREEGGWQVFVNWSDAVKVVFRAEVKEGLPWAFEPVQRLVMAKPGETLHAAYRAKNLADVRTSGQARHVDAPKELTAKYLDVIQCFCFIRQTLAPGEEKEMPLVFRIDLDVPREVKEFVVTYQFFPEDKFPNEEDDVRL